MAAGVWIDRRWRVLKRSRLSSWAGCGKSYARILVIAEYGGEAEPITLTQTAAKACFSRLLAFCDDALSGRLHRDLEESTPGYSLALNLYERRKNITRLRLYLVTE